jgi:hypothetical protein
MPGCIEPTCERGLCAFHYGAAVGGNAEARHWAIPLWDTEAGLGEGHSHRDMRHSYRRYPHKSAAAAAAAEAAGSFRPGSRPPGVSDALPPEDVPTIDEDEE